MSTDEIRANRRSPVRALSQLLAAIAAVCGACQSTQKDVASVQGNVPNVHAVAVPGKPGVLVRWRGSNYAFIDVLDGSQKAQLARLGCVSKGTCSQDLKAGNYYVKSGVPGYNQPLPIRITNSATTEIAPPVGT